MQEYVPALKSLTEIEDRLEHQSRFRPGIHRGLALQAQDGRFAALRIPRQSVIQCQATLTAIWQASRDP